MKYAAVGLILFVAGCGLRVPEVSQTVQSEVFVRDVHYGIFCETIEAVSLASQKNREIERITGQKNDFIENWGLKYSITLTTVENSSVSPTISAVPFEPSASGTVFTIGSGFGYSASATATQTAQKFSSVEYLRSLKVCDQENLEERHNIVPLGGKLGVSNWLISQLALIEAGIISSISTREPFTYRVAFDISASGGLTPTWAFTNKNTRSITGPLSGARSTKHSVLFTFGPVSADRLNLEANALAVHNARLVAEASSD